MIKIQTIYKTTYPMIVTKKQTIDKAAYLMIVTKRKTIDKAQATFKEVQRCAQDVEEQVCVCGRNKVK